MNLRSIAALLVLAFVGGAIAFGWFASDGNAPWMASDSKIKAPLASPVVPKVDASSVPAFIPTQPVVADSAHTEAMLLAIAARRAVENGKSLYTLLPRLQKAFGQTNPKALATLAESGEQPLSNAALLAEFETLGPQLARPAGTGWDRIRYELETLFVIRRGDRAPSPSSARLERIKQNLILGETATALRLVRGLPGAPNGADWIAKANKAVAVKVALDTLDNAAMSAITAPTPLTLPVPPIIPVPAPEVGTPDLVDGE
jgi:hypothetical protein